VITNGIQGKPGGETGRQRGFTLLEIMVVVLLISITATYAVVNLQRDDDRRAELELRRLAGIMEQLREESELSGKSYAIEFDAAQGRYQFLQAGAEGWEEMKDDLFREVTIPEPLRLQFKAGPAAGSGEARDLVVFLSDGSLTPFEVTLTGKTRVYRLYVDPAQNLLTENHEREPG
jgi:type II secretion system protein H